MVYDSEVGAVTSNRPVQVEQDDEVAIITVDDGKANAFSFETTAALRDALDIAIASAKAIVVAGRPGFLSAGLDLSVVGSGDTDRIAELMARSSANWRTIIEAPVPVVAACTGHALAAGAILLLAADYRVGVRGPFKLGYTETAIGVAMPMLGVRLAERRLDRRFVHAAVTLGRLANPDRAVEVGLLDEAVDDDVVECAVERAHELARLDGPAFAMTKHRVLRHLVDHELAANLWTAP